MRLYNPDGGPSTPSVSPASKKETLAQFKTASDGKRNLVCAGEIPTKLLKSKRKILILRSDA
ncbi:hypothetical protein QJS10_CPA09g01028 [Acorus calamus]|uniref:Uncharacterized protein n=1 Tax=Acorus calamus TaxID=4465 RepID=A0AAV9E3D2_ACOCL|nr:hypothetical protein QJS10_CPA09g01028 [Acorus calamus]